MAENSGRLAAGGIVETVPVMENFTYHNPTRLIFGRGQIATIDRELPATARVLLLAGGGSIKANGVHAQVKRALGTRVVQEFWGVEARAY